MPYTPILATLGYVFSPDSSRVLDSVLYEAQSINVSSGRYPNGAADWYPLATRKSCSLACVAVLAADSATDVAMGVLRAANETGIVQ